MVCDGLWQGGFSIVCGLGLGFGGILFFGILN